METCFLHADTFYPHLDTKSFQQSEKTAFHFSLSSQISTLFNPPEWMSKSHDWFKMTLSKTQPRRVFISACVESADFKLYTRKSYNNRNGSQQNNYAYNIYVLNVNNRSFLDILWFDNDALNYVK